VLGAFLLALNLRGHPLVFAVTNPPFNPWLALLFRRLRGWPYVVLVWDVYPDALVRFGYLREKSFITRMWRRVNRLVIESAESIITIGPVMAETIVNGCGACASDGEKVIVIPNWVDVQTVKPLAKTDNWFAREHGQTDKLTVLYSGNMGATHDLSAVLEAAELLRTDEKVSFLLIGDGSQREVLARAIAKKGLPNVTILPRQSEEALPYSLATGDIALVALGRGAEGISMPSKTYFMMAAGCAIVGVCHGENDLRATIEAHQCGLVVEPGDGKALAQAIAEMRSSPSRLESYRRNARLAAEKAYAESVCAEQYRAVLRRTLLHRASPDTSC
jgi:glycosyltransferase involved in cell wall biosynthesis